MYFPRFLLLFIVLTCRPPSSISSPLYPPMIYVILGSQELLELNAKVSQYQMKTTIDGQQIFMSSIPICTDPVPVSEIISSLLTIHHERTESPPTCYTPYLPTHFPPNSTVLTSTQYLRNIYSAERIVALHTPSPNSHLTPLLSALSFLSKLPSTFLSSILSKNTQPTLVITTTPTPTTQSFGNSTTTPTAPTTITPFPSVQTIRCLQDDHHRIAMLLFRHHLLPILHPPNTLSSSTLLPWFYLLCLFWIFMYITWWGVAGYIRLMKEVIKEGKADRERDRIAREKEREKEAQQKG
mmetsp:Transcript_22837/g.47369  ORF Transcript_22837/g.47369 Transcript_22837/m.47369 type:complete len:296 (-) Transcript_22837:25-912(-)